MGKLTKVLRAAKKAKKTAAEIRAEKKEKNRKAGSAEASQQRTEARKRRANKAEAKVTQKRATIGKTPVSKEDIKQATTAREMDTMQRRIDAMDDGMIKKSMQTMLDKHRKDFEKKQSDEVDRASRKSAQSNRDRNAPKVSLKEKPPFEIPEYSKGGAAKKKYSKGGMATGKPRTGHTDMRGKGLFK